jgi:hypothetical protein
VDKIRDEECYCKIHPLTLKICPRCIAAKGGRTTAKKYGTEQLARWGREGGRPAKKKRRSAKKKASRQRSRA